MIKFAVSVAIMAMILLGAALTEGKPKKHNPPKDEYHR